MRFIPIPPVSLGRDFFCSLSHFQLITKMMNGPKFKNRTMVKPHTLQKQHNWSVLFWAGSRRLARRINTSPKLWGPSKQGLPILYITCLAPASGALIAGKNKVEQQKILKADLRGFTKTFFKTLEEKSRGTLVICGCILGVDMAPGGSSACIHVAATEAVGSKELHVLLYCNTCIKHFLHSTKKN